MPNCKKCGSYFPNRVKIEGEQKLLASRKYCLVCSPYKTKNTRKLELEQCDKENKDDLPPNKICLICKKDLPQSCFGVYKRRDKWRIFSYCKQCDSERTKKVYLEYKQKAVDYKGGKCIICGYCRSLRALEFHHILGEEKEVSIANFRVRDWELLKQELDKCDLLCANCHREEHDPSIVKL